MTKSPEISLCVQAWNCAMQADKVNDLARARLRLCLDRLEGHLLSDGMQKIVTYCEAVFAPGQEFDGETARIVADLILEELRARRDVLGPLSKRDFYRPVPAREVAP